jgi:hypothetical protein
MGLGRPDGSRGDPAVGGRPQDTLLVAPLDGDGSDGRGPTMSPCSSSSSTLMTLIHQFVPLDKNFNHLVSAIGHPLMDGRIDGDVVDLYNICPLYINAKKFSSQPNRPNFHTFPPPYPANVFTAII